MTKADLISRMSEGSGLTKKQAEAALDAGIAAMSQELAEGKKITLVGFGTFDVGVRSARQGHNPRTKEVIQIPESKAIRFKAGKTLKDKVAQGPAEEGKAAQAG